MKCKYQSLVYREAGKHNRNHSGMEWWCHLDALGTLTQLFWLAIDNFFSFAPIFFWEKQKSLTSASESFQVVKAMCLAICCLMKGNKHWLSATGTRIPNNKWYDIHSVTSKKSTAKLSTTRTASAIATKTTTQCTKQWYKRLHQSHSQLTHFSPKDNYFPISACSFSSNLAKAYGTVT